MLCTLKDNPDVDFYVLCVVQGSVVEIKGWAWKSELVKEENKVDYGYGWSYGLDQRCLTQFKEDGK